MTKARKLMTKPRQQAGIWQKWKWLFIGSGVFGGGALLLVLTFAFSGPATTGGEVPVVVSRAGSSASAATSAVPVVIPTAGSSASALPDFPLTLYQGKELLGASDLQFASLLGKKPIVLNYWASACPPCAAEMPEFEKVWGKYKDKVLFVGLDVGRFAGLGGPETSKKELRQLGITYPAGPAPDIETVEKLGLRALPSTDFITPKGRVYKKWVGILNAAKLTELVEALLKEG